MSQQQPRSEAVQRLIRKANQEWELAGLARQDRDLKAAERHTQQAREYQRQAAELNNKQQNSTSIRGVKSDSLSPDVIDSIIVGAFTEPSAELVEAVCAQFDVTPAHAQDPTDEHNTERQEQIPDSL